MVLFLDMHLFIYFLTEVTHEHTHTQTERKREIK